MGMGRGAGKIILCDQEGGGGKRSVWWNETIQYNLATEASKTGTGGVLFQLIDCKPGVLARVANRTSMRIVMFISVRMSSTETRYATTKQEALAVFRCLQDVRWLVHGSAYPVFVYTDHSALIHLLKHDDAHGRVARGQLKLCEYDVEYIYVPGTQNVIADGLSRMPERYFTRLVGEMRGEGRGCTEEKSTARAKGDKANKGGWKNDREEEKEDEYEIGKQVGRGKGEGGNWKQPGEDEEDQAEWKEVLLVEGEGEAGEIWDAWKDSEWYGELVRFLLRGDFQGRDLTAAGRRRIRMWARNFVVFDGQRRKGLFYRERGGKHSLCVLEWDVVAILTRYHDCHGHFAARLLVQFLVGKAYWPTRARDAYYFARTCESCQAMGPLQPSVGSGAIVHLQPFDMVGLDFIGPITPDSNTGNKYIIIMVDYFTRFLFAKALTHATGAAARSLFESFTRSFGDPLSVYTDNGSHFTGEDIHGLLVEHGIKLIPAPKSHSSSVGLAERYVQLLMRILKRRVQTTSKRMWDTVIPRALRTLNTCGAKVHAYTPAELLLGYNS